MPKNQSKRVVDAALALASRRGWSSVSLAEIAAEAGLSLLQLYQLHPSKQSILVAFEREIDVAMLTGAEADHDEKPRDRLFDTVLRRFDALAPHKDAIRRILRDMRLSPASALSGAPQFLRSMGWMLETAGVPSTGWQGAIRAQMLGCLYLSVLRVWLDDDSADMAKTMATLDERLRRAEKWLGLSGAGSAAPRGRNGPSTRTAREAPS
jgi:AcrR family transcriptional regulator